MSVVLSSKGVKLMKLCEAEGFKTFDGLLRYIGSEHLCPAICMTEGCDHTTETEPDQTEGYCDACGGRTVVSALILADLV